MAEEISLGDLITTVSGDARPLMAVLDQVDARVQASQKHAEEVTLVPGSSSAAVQAQTQFIARTQAMTDSQRLLAAELLTATKSIDVAAYTWSSVYGVSLEQARQALSQYVTTMQQSASTSQQLAQQQSGLSQATLILSSSAQQANQQQAGLGQTLLIVGSSAQQANQQQQVLNQTLINAGTAGQQAAGGMGQAAAATQNLGQAAGGAGGSGGGGGLSTLLGAMGNLGPIGVALGLTINQLTNRVIELGEAALKAGADLQNSEAHLQAWGNLSQTQAQAVGDAFLSAGNSIFSASEKVSALATAAPVLEQITGRAVDAASSLTFMAAASDLAVATNTKLDTASVALAGTLRTYGLSLGSASNAAGVLAATQELTGIGAQAFSERIGRLHDRLGPLAPDLQQSAALLVAFAEAGVVGQRGLQLLETGVDHMVGTSKEARAELQTLGIQITNADGSMRTWAQIFPQLLTSLSGLSASERLAAEQMLFGVTAGAAWDEVIRKGIPGMTEATNALHAHADAHEQAAIRAGTFTGELDKAKASVKNFAAEVLGFVTGPATQFLHFLNTVSWEHFLSPQAAVMDYLASFDKNAQTAVKDIADLGTGAEKTDNQLKGGVSAIRDSSDAIMALATTHKSTATEIENSAALMERSDAAAAKGFTDAAINFRIAAGMMLAGKEELAKEWQKSAATQEKADQLVANAEQTVATATHNAVMDRINDKLILAGVEQKIADSGGKLTALEIAQLRNQGQEEQALADKRESNANKYTSLLNQAAVAGAEGHFKLQQALLAEAEAYRTGDTAGQKYAATLVQIAEQNDRMATTLDNRAKKQQAAEDSSAKSAAEASAAITKSTQQQIDVQQKYDDVLSGSYLQKKQVSEQSIKDDTALAQSALERLKTAKASYDEDQTAFLALQQQKIAAAQRGDTEVVKSLTNAITEKAAALATDVDNINKAAEQVKTAQTSAFNASQQLFQQWEAGVKAQATASRDLGTEIRSSIDATIKAYTVLALQMPAEMQQGLTASLAEVQRTNGEILALTKQLTQELEPEERKRLENVRAEKQGELAAQQANLDAMEAAAKAYSTAISAGRKADLEEFKANVAQERAIQKANLDAELSDAVAAAQQKDVLGQRQIDSQNALAVASLRTASQVASIQAQIAEAGITSTSTAQERTTAAIQAGLQQRIAIIKAHEAEIVEAAKQTLIATAPLVAAEVEAKRQAAIAEADFKRAETQVSIDMERLKVDAALATARVQIAAAQAAFDVAHGADVAETREKLESYAQIQLAAIQTAEVQMAVDTKVVDTAQANLKVAQNNLAAAERANAASAQEAGQTIAQASADAANSIALITAQANLAAAGLKAMGTAGAAAAREMSAGFGSLGGGGLFAKLGTGSGDMFSNLASGASGGSSKPVAGADTGIGAGIQALADQLTGTLAPAAADAASAFDRMGASLVKNNLDIQNQIAGLKLQKDQLQQSGQSTKDVDQKIADLNAQLGVSKQVLADEKAAFDSLNNSISSVSDALSFLEAGFNLQADQASQGASAQLDALNISRDQLEIAGASTTEIDKQIRQVQAQIRLTHDQAKAASDAAGQYGVIKDEITLATDKLKLAKDGIDANTISADNLAKIWHQIRDDVDAYSKSLGQGGATGAAASGTKFSGQHLSLEQISATHWSSLQDYLDAYAVHLGVGGIVRGPTLAMIGESGPEAVIPLGTNARPTAQPMPTELSAPGTSGGASGGVGTAVLNVHMDGHLVTQIVASHLQDGVVLDAPITPA